MAAKVVSLRLPVELLEWADAYAARRGVSRTELIVEGLRSFAEGCESGVPVIRSSMAAPKAIPGVRRGSSVLAARQAALNAAKERVSG